MRHFVGHLSCRFVFVLGTVWIYLFFLSRRWLIVGLIDWWLQPEQFAHTGLSYVYDTAGGPQVEEIEGAPEDRQFAFRAFLLMSAKLVTLYFFEITSFAALVFWLCNMSDGTLGGESWRYWGLWTASSVNAKGWRKLHRRPPLISEPWVPLSSVCCLVFLRILE